MFFSRFDGSDTLGWAPNDSVGRTTGRVASISVPFLSCALFSSTTESWGGGRRNLFNWGGCSPLNSVRSPITLLEKLLKSGEKCVSQNLMVLWACFRLSAPSTLTQTPSTFFLRNYTPDWIRTKHFTMPGKVQVHRSQLCVCVCVCFFAMPTDVRIYR